MVFCVTTGVPERVVLLKYVAVKLAPGGGQGSVDPVWMVPGIALLLASISANLCVSPQGRLPQVSVIESEDAPARPTARTASSPNRDRARTGDRIWDTSCASPPQ